MKAIDSHALTIKIIIGMIAGISLGLILNYFGWVDGWVKTLVVDGAFLVVGKIFVASLQLLVVPLVLVSLICGTAALDDIRKVGTVGLKTLVLYLATTAIAISLAMGAALIVKPGKGIDGPAMVEGKQAEVDAVTRKIEDLGLGISEVKQAVNELAEKVEGVEPPFALEEGTAVQKRGAYEPKEAPPFSQVLIDIFPRNPFAAMSEGRMLQVIVFAVLFGLALTQSGEAGQRILGVFSDLNAVVMKLVVMIMLLAPYGVFCLVSRTFATQGGEALLPLFKYFVLVIGVLLLHGAVTYPVLLASLARLNPLQFLKQMWEVQVFAFSTASSNATLPVTLNAVENKLGVKNSVASFTVPLGATINMDGTAIMQGVATIFIAQAWNIDLSFAQLGMVIVTATMASIGTAGVPGVGLIMLSMVLLQVGLPVEGIAIIIGIDRILDMIRTAVNVTGDAMVTCVVGKWEGALDKDKFNQDAS